MRILRGGKSKYYRSALGHFRHAQSLYLKAAQTSEWESLVNLIRTAHSRKTGFLRGFEVSMANVTQTAKVEPKAGG